jgi:ABC-2 type transport system permease protein
VSPILTVARREILQAARQKSLLVSTAFTIAVLAAVTLLPDALGLGGPSERDVVAAGPAARALAEQARAAQAPFDVELRVRGVATDAQARALVSDGEADVAVLAGGRRVLVAEGDADRAVAAIEEAARRRQAVTALERADVSRDVIGQALDPPGVPVERTTSGGGEGIAFLALLVLYGQLLGYGFVVASGIVEEKSSRVVELLLSVLSPRELLAGKVLGIGVVGLVQLLVIAAAGLAIGVAAGALDLDGEALGALVVVLAWFLLGYGLFSAAFAVAGALVPRQEDLQTVTTPLTAMLVAVFILSFPALEDPGGGLARTLSLLPFSAPMVMPVRLIVGEVPAWEVLVAIAATLAATGLLVVLAGRVYRAAALETRAAIGLRAALRRS